MTRIARLGLLPLCVALSGCPQQPVKVVTMCPAIPANLTETCYVEESLPQTNGELATQWINLRACALEQTIKLDTIRALAECRIDKP